MAGELGFEPRFSESEFILPVCFVSLFLQNGFRRDRLGSKG